MRAFHSVRRAFWQSVSGVNPRYHGVRAYANIGRGLKEPYTGQGIFCTGKVRVAHGSCARVERFVRFATIGEQEASTIVFAMTVPPRVHRHLRLTVAQTRELPRSGIRLRQYSLTLYSVYAMQGVFYHLGVLVLFWPLWAL
jgi:hypothetical protein